MADVALHQRQLGQKPGKFWSVVNEGDPVPQAQEQFIKRLIEVYVLKRTDLKTRYPEDVSIPRGHFRASGHTVILRDEDSDNVGDGDDDIGAYTTSSTMLETRLFGNGFVHSSDLYRERIVQLARTASIETDCEEGSEEDKEIAIGLEPLND